MRTTPRNSHTGKKIYLYLFQVIAIFHVIMIAAGQEDLAFYSKPLLIPTLFLYFISNHRLSAFRELIAAALIFSWIGDVLLMFVYKSSTYFLLGLSAFLIAHVFYILFYHKVRLKENIQSRWWLVPVVAVYYAVLISFLFPRLGTMRVPVPVYGIVITFMLLLALHMLFLRAKAAGTQMAFGAILFIISDSILAFNKFYQPFEQSGWMIMLTYCVAQLLIVMGALRYIFPQTPLSPTTR